MVSNNYIILIDGRDITVFPSIEKAEAYIEPYDVNVYQIYDQKGYTYKAHIIKGGRYELVHLEKRDFSESTVGKLKSQLISHLAFMGEEEESMKRLSLDELVQIAAEKASI